MRKRNLCEKELRELYIDKLLPTWKIAEAFHINSKSLREELVKYNIPLRPKGNRKKRLPSDDVIKKLYLEEGLSSNQIAKKYGMIGNTPVCIRLRKMGITRPEKGINSRHRKPNAKKYAKGYSLTFMPNHPRAQAKGYVFDHILIAEKKYGFTSKPKDIIHHIDIDKTNNSPDNLLLCDCKQHRKHHSQLMKLIKPLFERGIISFSTDKGYFLVDGNPKS